MIDVKSVQVASTQGCRVVSISVLFLFFFKLRRVIIPSKYRKVLMETKFKIQLACVGLPVSQDFTK